MDRLLFCLYGYPFAIDLLTDNRIDVTIIVYLLAECPFTALRAREKGAAVSNGTAL